MHRWGHGRGGYPEALAVMSEKEARLKIVKRLIDLGRQEAMANAMEALDPSIEFETAFSMVNEMQNENLIKLVYCVPPAVINVQLTRVGLDWYQNKSRA